MSSCAGSLIRLCIAAPQGGGGKSLVTIGLARAFSHLGYCVKPFKKGPDYIDAAWLALAAHNPATNLDPFFLSRHALRELFFTALARVPMGKASAKIALLEGNRGLYDGFDAAGSCATAELARGLDCPVVLVLSCTKMTRTAAALIQGLLNFEPNTPFAGCILNNVGTKRQEALLREVLAQETDLPLFGVLPRLPENLLPERHMGLASFGEHLGVDADARIERIATFVKDHVDLARLLDGARKTPLKESPTVCHTVAHDNPDNPVTIAVLRDAAFWFYYEENLAALRSAGARLKKIALIPEEGMATEDIDWAAIDGLYLGGGFPEDYAATLATNPSLARIRALADQDLPIYAECGGFMLLARSLRTQEHVYPMANIFGVDVELCTKPQGLGYIEAEVTRETPFYPKGFCLRGHEFHYSRAVIAPSQEPVLCVTRGHGMGIWQGKNVDALLYKNVWASYTHIFAQSIPLWATNFVALARAYRAKREAIRTKDPL